MRLGWLVLANRARTPGESGWLLFVAVRGMFRFEIHRETDKLVPTYSREEKACLKVDFGICLGRLLRLIEQTSEKP